MVPGLESPIGPTAPAAKGNSGPRAPRAASPGHRPHATCHFLRQTRPHRLAQSCPTVQLHPSQGPSTLPGLFQQPSDCSPAPHWPLWSVLHVAATGPYGTPHQTTSPLCGPPSPLPSLARTLRAHRSVSTVAWSATPLPPSQPLLRWWF